jgi:hypothetical protein
MPFRPPSNLNRPLTPFAGIFSGFVLEGTVREA